MLRTIDRILIVAVILLAAGEAYLFAGPAASPGPPGLPGPAMLASMPVTGRIIDIDEHRIVVTPDIGPPGTSAGKQRRFKLTDTTEVIEQTPREPRAFQAEMAAFQKRMAHATPAGGPPPAPPPMPFEEKRLTVADLRAGDRVTVMPALGKAEGTAARIVRQITPPPPDVSDGTAPSPVAPPPAPRKADPADGISHDERKE